MFAMKTVTALPFQPQRKHGLHVYTVSIHDSKASLLCSGVLSVSDLASPIRVPTHSIVILLLQNQEWVLKNQWNSMLCSSDPYYSCRKRS